MILTDAALLDELKSREAAPHPRIFTGRTPDTATRGQLMAAIAELAGIDLIEWQRIVTGAALEIGDDGKWLHPLVAILVARQNGKTKLLVARILTGLFALDDRLILHTAQDRTVPGETFAELVERIEATRSLRRRIPRGGIRTSNGKERIRTADGSTYRILAPRQEAFRTWSADLLIFDEAREQHDWALWSAAVPTQRARPNPQRFVVSNAGDVDSVVLNEISDRGRAAAAMPGSDPAICYAEYSAPDDAAVNNVDGIVAANPALGVLVSPDAIVEELRTLPEDRYRTEILCQRVKVSTVSAVPADRWRACAGDPPEFDPSTTRPYMAFDLHPDRDAGALVAAAWRDDRLVVELVASWADPDGIDELAIRDEIGEWISAWRPAAVGYNPATAGAIAGWLDRRPVRDVKITGADWYTACAQLWETVANGTLMHHGDDELTRQVMAANRVDVGDGYWYIARRDAEIPIPAAVALARAVYLAYTPTPHPSVR